MYDIDNYEVMTASVKQILYFEIRQAFFQHCLGYTPGSV